jgi:hypothetical protein
MRCRQRKPKTHLKQTNCNFLRDTNPPTCQLMHQVPSRQHTAHRHSCSHAHLSQCMLRYRPRAHPAQAARVACNCAPPTAALATLTSSTAAIAAKTTQRATVGATASCSRVKLHVAAAAAASAQSRAEDLSQYAGSGLDGTQVQQQQQHLHWWPSHVAEVQQLSLLASQLQCQIDTLEPGEGQADCRHHPMIDASPTHPPRHWPILQGHVQSPSGTYVPVTHSKRWLVVSDSAVMLAHGV